MGVIKNFTYYGILTLSSYIMGFIVFPYVSRVLGVDNIGIVGFVDNTVNYFLIFASLGINTVGIRAIAACGNDRDKRSEVFSGLIVWTFFFTLAVSIIYIIVISTVPKLYEHKELYYIGLSKLIFTPFLIEWFFTGIENFKYITIRSILIKILYAVSVFVFVNDADDIVIYFLLTSITVVINSLINILYSRRFIFLRLANLKLKKYIKQILVFGLFQILISMYSTFNIIFLGIVSTNTEVGYYYTALKLYTIITGFYVAFTSVMLPRMSSLLALDNKDGFNEMIIKSLNGLFTFLLPITIGGTILAPQIVMIIFGHGYEGAIVPMQIMMPLLLIAGISQLNALQVLIPMHKDNVLLTITPIVAIIGITANLLLVSKYAAIGSAIVLFISESTGAVIGLIYSIKKKLFIFPYKIFIINILYSIPYVFICWGSAKMNLSPIITISIAGTGCVLYFVFLQFKIIKNIFLINTLKAIFIK